MHNENRHLWQHGHSFGQEKKRPGEFRTIIVIAMTATMMVVEIAAGIVFGSMALLADGLHMASHAAALSISAFAYVYARRHAHDERYSLGTGKVNSLGGFTGAVLLAVFALMMVWESVVRIIYPVDSVEHHDDNRVADLHLWPIGPNICAVELTIVTHEPQLPDHYTDMLPKEMEVVHVNVEVHRCVHEDELDGADFLRDKITQSTS